jgi:hypothetical protein
MTHIVLTEDQARVIGGATDAVQVRDTAGRVVGYIEPVDFTLEEIRQAKQEIGGPSLTTPQLVEYLRSLG